MRHWSLRARFLLVLIILMVAVFAAITLLIVRQNTHTLRNNLVAQSRSFAALATQPIGNAFVLYKDSGTIRIGQEVTSFTDLDHDISQVEIFDTNAKRLFTNAPGGTSIPVSQTAAGELTPTYIRDKSGDIVAIVQPYLESFGIHRYNVAYRLSYQSVDQSIRNIVSSILALSAGILLISLIVWYFFINRLFLRPVAQVSQAALLISQGELNRQIHLGRNDEIGDLANAVDTMASALKADIVKLQAVDKLKSEFLMITAHNLRTPLTIIKGYLERLKGMKPAPELQDVMELISTNVTRLDSFSEDALTISSIEADQTTLPRGPIEMKPLLQDAATEFAALAKQKSVNFKVNLEATAWVNLSKPHFRSALWNLLDNAYKFTPEGGSIELSTTVTNGHLEVAIKDSGIGIAAAEIPHLFTKFHRATDTLTYNYEGTGIGLYISKLVIEQYGGGIKVESTEGKGSTFIIWLPTIPPPPAPTSAAPVQKPAPPTATAPPKTP
jgi:signal transduction histidine kinase